MISLQLILATALFGSLGESRFIVDLTHTYDKDATIKNMRLKSKARFNMKRIVVKTTKPDKIRAPPGPPP